MSSASGARGQRMGVVMSALRKRSAAQRRQDEQAFEEGRERLTRGERIDQPSLWADSLVHAGVHVQHHARRGHDRHGKALDDAL